MFGRLIFLTTIVGALATTGAGLTSYELVPQKMYISPGQVPSPILLTLNVSYIDSPADGIDLNATSLTFSSETTSLTTVNCSPNSRLGTGTGDRKSVIQNCTIAVPADTPAGHYTLSGLSVKNLVGVDIRPPNTGISVALNRLLTTPLCLPPYFTITRVSPSEAISITNIKINQSIAVIDGTNVKIASHIEFKAPNGANISTISLVYSPLDVNASSLSTNPCVIGNATGPADAPTSGDVWCDIFIPVSQTLGEYQLSNVFISDTKGNTWNSERMDTLLSLDSDTNEHHMDSHLGAGSLFHSHLCSLPRISVIDEARSCPPQKLLSCMTSNTWCDRESYPACPPERSCQIKYRFAKCATQLYCYDALSLWCQGGFFKTDRQVGCDSNLAPFCSAIVGRTHCKALGENGFQSCAKYFDPKKDKNLSAKDQCAKKRMFNTCAFMSGCNAMGRDVSKCDSSPVIFVPPPPGARSLGDSELLLQSVFNHKAAHDFGQAAPRSRATGTRAIWIVGAACATVVGATLLVVLRRRQGRIEDPEQQLL